MSQSLINHAINIALHVPKILVVVLETAVRARNVCLLLIFFLLVSGLLA